MSNLIKLKATTANDTRKPSRMVYVFMFVLLMCMLFLGYEGMRFEQIMSKKLQNTTTKITDLNLEQKNMDTMLRNSQKINQFEQQKTQLLLNHLDHQMQSVRSPEHDTSYQFNLIKAQYAIELAQFNAYWSNDRNTTINLLQYADQILAQQNNPDLFALRQALAQDILAQQTAPSVDQTGLLSQLRAIQQSIENCPLNQTPPTALTATQTTEPTPSTRHAWRARLEHYIGLIKHFFIIQYHPDPMRPLMTSDYKKIQREIILLNLQEIEWAVLQSNATIYQSTLQQTIQHMQRTFDKTNPIAQQVLEKLNQLLQTPVQYHRIIPSESLTQINALIKTSEPPLSIIPSLAPTPTSYPAGAQAS